MDLYLDVYVGIHIVAGMPTKCIEKYTKHDLRTLSYHIKCKYDHFLTIINSCTKLCSQETST